jgi:hypothetical protein
MYALSSGICQGSNVPRGIFLNPTFQHISNNMHFSNAVNEIIMD